MTGPRVPTAQLGSSRSGLQLTAAALLPQPAVVSFLITMPLFPPRLAGGSSTIRATYHLADR